MKKYRRGYTQGVYDMFHVGHLNLINNAKKYCDYLVVGVNSDRLVQEYKHKTPVINEHERRYIVENIKAVNETVIAETLDKVKQLELIGYDAVFIGDDWKDDFRWIETKEVLANYGVDVVFLPYTQGICSTDLSIVQNNRMKEIN